ncbi:carboxypeptidase-like regulatory domain-containing protein [Inquilinus sp. KBS0705]|nr:carboxypeptidase-like regulatory domain-containing protein [Inquilinus sp. KBS0705]
MNFKNFLKPLFFLILLFISTTLAAQTTVVTGTVTDAGNKQPLPFVTITFIGSTIGVNSNNDGKYTIRSAQNYTQLKVTYLGYKDAILTIQPGKEQVLNVRLFPSAKQLGEVVVKSKKNPPYHNKDNPAVELIRRVIANKAKNRPESYPFVEYREYDKMQFSLSNLSEKVPQKKFLRKYKFIFDNRDSTSYAGKSLLPIYLEEKLSQVYYRKNPEKLKEVVLGQKGVNFGPAFDSEGIGQYFKHLYEKVDIYDNSILLLGKQFLSPIADAAPTFYKFFITDTITTDNNIKLVQLSFTPRNTNDVLFEGDIYITLDGNYAVQKAGLTINKNINVNFVRSMHVDQDFEQNPDGRFHLSKSNTFADFGVTQKRKSGLFGVRTITYKNYIVNKPHPDTTYLPSVDIGDDAVKHRSESFWQQNRLDTLTTAESKVYKNIDSLTHMPSFRRTADIVTLLFAGFKGFGKFEVGPASTFYSFNPVEGFRLRLGGRTTTEFSKRVFLESYAAYGFKDDRWKYFLKGTYSLNSKSIYKFPQNYISASVQRDTKIPGQELQFIQEDNILLSFKRGTNDKYLYNDFYRIDYVHEYENHFSYKAGLRKWIQTPAGTLFPFLNGDNTIIQHLSTTEATFGLRYAPHEQYYQGKLFRTPIINQYPILSLDFTAGLKNVLNGEYGYQNVKFRGEKRFYIAPFGHSDIILEGNKTFGQLPYPLLNIHRANQTYAYVIDSYNLMNFLEFVSDKSVSINIDQHFEGFFFNKIPLFKRLKWRETASFKMLYGGVSDENNVSIHPSLYQYPTDGVGNPITYALGKTPYIEGSVGIENIFKFVRVDFVKRFTYLDHPDIAQWGIRTKIKFDF